MLGVAKVGRRGWFSDAWIIRAGDHKLFRSTIGKLPCLRRGLLSSLLRAEVEFQHRRAARGR
jgi:hypothetical protein